MGALLAMRIVALALLVCMLFEPVLRFIDRPRPEKPLLLLIDTSGSMSFPDLQNGPTRLQSVWQTLQPQLEKIQANFIPRYFTFSTHLDELSSAGELERRQADGQATDIVHGVGEALSQSTRPDAAILLISDGIDNTSPDVVNAIGASRRTIHTIRVGSEQAASATMANIAVDNIETPDDFLVRHETKVKATITSSALANRMVDVKLAPIDADGKPIGEIVSEKLVLNPLPQGQTVELPFKPDKPGVHRLAVWVDPVAGERSTIDNRQEFQGLALDPRIKVLYIEGRARPEYRELNRALARDPNIEIASLLRIHDDRFAAAGSVEGEPLKEMPTTPEQWKRFDVILLGDLDSSFLSPAQQSAIHALVEDGAGLLMIGGQNSFGPGGYKDTAIERALPVFVGELSAGQEKTDFVPRLTPEGASHPAMEGLADWFAAGKNSPADPEKSAAPPSGSARETLPALRGNVVVRSAKSGATVLLTHSDRLGGDGQPQIVLATQRYGEGRSAAFTADTTYLWYLPLRGMGQESPYNRFWGQLVRWLASSDVRDRQLGAGIEALLNKSLFTLGENVNVRALVRDELGDATRYAQVTLSLRRNDESEPVQLTLNPSEARNGMYGVIIPTPDKGEYTAEILASKDGKELGRRTLNFSVIPPAEEMLKLAADGKLLGEIASATGGFHYTLAQLPVLIDELVRLGGAPVSRQQSAPLANTIKAGLVLLGADPQWPKRYDLPMQGLLVIALLTGEWILRRKWRLP